MVEGPLGVEVGPAAALDWSGVSAEECLAIIGIADGSDRVVRADLLTHTAAAAEVLEACHLLDDGPCDVLVNRLGLAVLTDGDRLCLHCNFDSLEGTTCNAASAHCTPVSVIFYLPRQVIDSYILGSYLFHVITPLTTIHSKRCKYSLIVDVIQPHLRVPLNRPNELLVWHINCLNNSIVRFSHNL